MSDFSLLTLHSLGNIMTSMAISDFVKVAEAAMILGFSVQHTRLLVRQGQLMGNKIGRDWIIERESLQSFLARRGTQTMLVERKSGRPPTVPPGGKKLR